jgi:methionyl-tRNA synthetase
MITRPFYLTTSITYPNGDPHMGHALEWVQADFLARYYRAYGDQPVRFQIGLDEHGLKMQQAADAAGKPTQAYMDEKALAYEVAVKKLGISHDRFIRTTDNEHKAMAQALWNACVARGDIYKKTYRAWYNIKQEEFLGLADEIKDPAVFGIDPQFIELIEEENYFFAQSKYTEQVLNLLKTEQYKVWPKSRAQEMINFAETKGLQDISISRDKAKLSWGVSVPGDENQVMYVWFDALTNYLTGAARIENGQIIPNEFWPAELHCVGKDISRFHGLLWPAMLLSAGLEVPKNLLVHGFILTNGQTMSKSVGNGVDPMDMIEKYGLDALRWYFLAEIPTTGDGDFTVERLGEVYASDLANDYGNLVSRVHTMCKKYCDGGVPQVAAEEVDNLEKVIVEEKWREYHAAVAEMDIKKALEAPHALVVFCNRRIEEHKPWAMAKDEDKKAALNELLYELLEIIRTVTAMLQPAIPGTCATVARDLFPSLSKEAWQGANAEQWGLLEAGSALGGESLMLFPRIEHA